MVKQIIEVDSRFIDKLIKQINETLNTYKNAELVAVVERDRALRAFIQYDVETK